MNNETPSSDVSEKEAPVTSGGSRAETDIDQGELSSNAGAGTSKIPLPDYAASIAFLRRFHPGRFWVLTAISLDKRSIKTQTFDADSVAECLAWLREQGESKNLYFSVAEVPRKVEKKAERTDIANVWWLHVDIDPRAGEPLATEQPRILALLTKPGNLPPPTVIVYSGGGYQAFWKLDNPIPINRELAKAEDAKRYNLQIEIVLGADNVHNIDRIMRLPGTLNRPDEKKIAKGRTTVMAEVIEWHDEQVYSIDQFGKAPEIGAGAASALGATGSHRAVISDNVKRLASVDELPAGVHNRVKVVVCQGFDPDEPNKFDGRSEWLFYACCGMVRGGCDDDTIYSVITDPQFRISESVLDKGRDRHKYALKQISSARDDVNRKAKEEWLPATKAGKQTDDDKPSMRDLGRALLKHHGVPVIHLNNEYHTWQGGAYLAREDDTFRSEAYSYLETIGAKPGQGMVSNVLDAFRSLIHLERTQYTTPCWKDLREEPHPNQLLVCRNGLLHLPAGRMLPHNPDFLTHNALEYDYDPQAAPPAKWLEFLKQVWPGDDEQDCIDSLQQWFGYLLTPDTSQQKILVLVGPRRSGKGTISRILAEILGKHNIAAPRLKQFGEQFGLQCLINKQVATIGDLRLGANADKSSIAEALLTISGEDIISVPRKNLQDWSGQLRTRFVIMSNEAPTLPDPSGALPSRFVVLEMKQCFLGREDPTLTDTLKTERSGILNWAIEGWKKLQAAGRLKQPASSCDLVKQIQRGSSEILAFREDRCELVPGAIVTKDVLYQEYVGWARESGITHLPKKEVFCKDLLSAFRGELRACKPRSDGKPVPAFEGIRLMPKPAEPVQADIPF